MAGRPVLNVTALLPGSDEEFELSYTLLKIWSWPQIKRIALRLTTLRPNSSHRPFSTYLLFERRGEVLQCPLVSLICNEAVTTVLQPADNERGLQGSISVEFHRVCL